MQIFYNRKFTSSFRFHYHQFINFMLKVCRFHFIPKLFMLAKGRYIWNCSTKQFSTKVNSCFMWISCCICTPIPNAYLTRINFKCTSFTLVIAYFLPENTSAAQAVPHSGSCYPLMWSYDGTFFLFYQQRSKFSLICASVHIY